MDERMWRNEVLAALLMIHETLEQIKHMMENDDETRSTAEANEAQNHYEQPVSQAHEGTDAYPEG
jgi:hypothetical protein